MAISMKGNRFNVRPTDPAFSVSTNLCDWLELGSRQGGGHWLEGAIAAGEFVFNGRLFLPGLSDHGTILDNFPRAPAPSGWSKYPRENGSGYSLVEDATGRTIFGFRVEDKICLVTVNIYAADGALVAESLPDEFRLHRGPAKIGRGGILIG